MRRRDDDMDSKLRQVPLLRPVEAGAHVPAWGAAADELWPAWRQLMDWEDRVGASLGIDVGAHLIVLWILSRFGGSPALLGELIDDELLPRVADPVVEDMMAVAFALGAAWMAAGDSHGRPPGILSCTA
jgi:hypothetical protein